MRLVSGESNDSPRVILFYGHKAMVVGNKVEKELSKVGHVVTLVDAGESIKYAQVYAVRWINGKEVNDLNAIGAAGFEEQEIISKAKETILEYLTKNPQISWRDIKRSIRFLNNLAENYHIKLKEWFSNIPRRSAILEKVKVYLEKEPTAKWGQVRRKFHLERISKLERDTIRQALNL